MSDRSKSLENMIPMILNVEPLVLELGSRLHQALKEPSAEPFSERLLQCSMQASMDLGLVLPKIMVRPDSSLAPRGFAVKVREIEVFRGKLPETFSPLRIRAEMEKEISGIFRRYAHEFLGFNETQALLAHLRTANADLAGAVYPSLLSLTEIQRVLRNLLKEQVPIRPLPNVFEALREYAVYTRDPDVLTEYARQALSRVIGSRHQKTFVIRAYLLDPEIEQLVAGAVRWEERAFLEFEPAVSDKIIKVLTRRFERLKIRKGGEAVLLVSPEIRRFVRMLLERAAPEIPVLSTAEIAPEYKIKSLGMISQSRWPPFLNPVLNAFKKRGRQAFPGDDLQKALLVLNLLGPLSGKVANGLSPGEYEILRARAAAAPVPVQGKDAVIREFLSFLPKDRKVENLESLIHLASREPAVVAAALEERWLSQFSRDEEIPAEERPNSAVSQRDEMSPKEKAALFVSGTARWVQEEVYRCLSEDDLRHLGRGMLQFPFISPEAKRKTWEDCEAILQKDEWWDAETLAHFVRHCAGGRLEDFKKRGFRQSQTLAILLLSLPAQRAASIGKEVLERLHRSALAQVLIEMSQWRDHIPVEARAAALSDFLEFAASMEKPDFEFQASFAKLEAERIVQRDGDGAAAVARHLWLSSPDAWSVFESLALQMPDRVARRLTSFSQRPSPETALSGRQKAAVFLSALPSDLANLLKSKLSLQEKSLLEPETAGEAALRKIFREFLHGYYGGSHPTPVPFLKRN